MQLRNSYLAQWHHQLLLVMLITLNIRKIKWYLMMMAYVILLHKRKNHPSTKTLEIQISKWEHQHMWWVWNYMTYFGRFLVTISSAEIWISSITSRKIKEYVLHPTFSKCQALQSRDRTVKTTLFHKRWWGNPWSAIQWAAPAGRDGAPRVVQWICLSALQRNNRPELRLGEASKSKGYRDRDTCPSQGSKHGNALSFENVKWLQWLALARCKRSYHLKGFSTASFSQQ